MGTSSLPKAAICRGQRQQCPVYSPERQDAIFDSGVLCMVSLLEMRARVEASPIARDVEAADAGDGPQRVEDLPPLPRPDLQTMRGEATTGCIVVSIITGLLVSIPHSIAYTSGWQWPDDGLDFTALCLVLLWAEAGVAFICLLGLMWGDPGVIKRTPERCQPVPVQVLERWHNGQTTVGMANVNEGNRTYCVRCLVWRTSSGRRGGR